MQVPNIETLIEISKVFDITIDELLKGDETLQEKIIKDGKQLKYPRLKFFFDVLLIIGIIAVIISLPMTLILTPIALIACVNGLLIGLVGWVGTFFTSKRYA